MNENVKKGPDKIHTAVNCSLIASSYYTVQIRIKICVGTFHFLSKWSKIHNEFFLNYSFNVQLFSIIYNHIPTYRFVLYTPTVRYPSLVSFEHRLQPMRPGFKSQAGPKLSLFPVWNHVISYK